MKTLELTFKSSDLHLKTLRLKYVADNLTAADVHAVMGKMAAANLFAKGDHALYATPVSAAVVETTKTPLDPTPEPVA